MNFNIFRSIPNKPKTTALGLTVAGTMAMHLLIVPWEKTELKPYLDVGGVPTACSGVTGPDITQAYIDGRVFTGPECEHLDAVAVLKHELALRDAISNIIEPTVPDLTMAAFISFTYNVGGTAARKSTLVRLINDGDLYGACGQLSRWVFVKGVKINGLDNRRVKGDHLRVSEQTVCLSGLSPSYKTPLFEKVFSGYIGWVERLVSA